MAIVFTIVALVIGGFILFLLKKSASRKRSDDSSDRADLLCQIAEALAVAGDATGAKETCKEALKILRAIPLIDIHLQ